MSQVPQAAAPNTSIELFAAEQWTPNPDTYQKYIASLVVVRIVGWYCKIYAIVTTQIFIYVYFYCVLI